MNAGKIIFPIVYLLTLLLTLTMANSRHPLEKRAPGPSTFNTMMRYGRNEKDRKVNIHPRADAFFLGPRYGKRSTWSPNSSLIYPVSTPLCGMDEELSCAYTGIANLYRCTTRIDNANGDFSTSN